MMNQDNHSDSVDQLVEDYAERLRRGESPSLSEYTQKHPDLADQIREIFPVVMEIESHGRQARQSNGAENTMEIPERLGDYVVLEQIGQGGMGVVFKARHQRMKRDVAIKILPQQKLDDDASVQRFFREVEALAKLIHPNIVTAFDAGEHEGVHYLVMEFVDGKNLAEIVNQGCPISVGQALQCILQVARGLCYAHAHGVIHRDIKPANLVLDMEGNVKILDMGLSRLAEENNVHDPEATSDQQLTGSGQIMGTPDYLSPEQAEDTHQADERSDIYSLGCTLYALLVGKPVYAGETPIKKLLAHREADVPSLRSERDDVPETIDALFQTMVAKKPEDRQQSMEEVIEQLQEYAGELPPAQPLTSFPGSERAGTMPRHETITFAASKTEKPAAETIIDTARSKSRRRLFGAAAVMLFCAFLIVAFLVDPFGLFSRSPEDLGPDTNGHPIANEDQIVLVRTFAGHTWPLRSVLFSADGRKLFTTGVDETVRVYDVQTGELLHTINTGHINATMEVLADGKRVVIGSSPEGRVAIWNVESGKRLCEFPGHSGQMGGLAVSFDERWLITGSQTGDETTMLWDLRSKKLEPVQKYPGCCGRAAISPNGRFGLRSAGDRLVLWELASGKESWNVEGGYATSLAFAHDGQLILSAFPAGAKVHLIEAKTGKILWALPIPGFSVAFLPDGRHFVVGVFDKTLRVFNLLTRKEVLRIQNETYSTNLVAVSPDGRYLAAGGGWSEKGKDGDYDVRLWRLPQKLPDGPETQITHEKDSFAKPQPVEFDKSPNDEIVLSHTFPQHPSSIGLLRFTTDGNKLITGCRDGVLRVFEMPDGKTATQQIPTGSAVAGAVVLKDGRRVVTGEWNGAVQLWELETGKLLRSFTGHTGPVYAVAVSPDQQWLLTGSRDKTIRLWNLETAQIKHEFKGQCDAVAFFPNGRSALYVTNEALVCWDVQTGTENWRKDYRNIFRLAISHDGKWILTGNHSGLVRLIAADSAEVVHTVTLNGTARGVHFLPNGKHFITGGDDKTLRLFEIQTGDEVARIVGKNHYTGDVGVSADGRYVATGRGSWFDAKGVHFDDDYAPRLWRLADPFVAGK